MCQYVVFFSFSFFFLFPFFKISFPIVDENAPISELKVMFAKKLKDEKNIDIEPERLRIRESTWRSVGKVYPNNSTFKQCASFLWAGKAYAFQRLQGEETVTSSKSLILYIRRWFPSTWQLGPIEEVRVNLHFF